MEKRAEKHGYVPYGMHDPEESRAETVARFFNDPSLGRDIPMEKRYKPEKWRQKIIEKIKDKHLGDTVIFRWDVFIKRKSPLNQELFGSKHKVVRIKYKKLNNGYWLNLQYGSDNWPKGTIKNPPNLNHILDTKISNRELSEEMGNYDPPNIISDPIFGHREV